jgi:uncharacterized protein (DUF2141 family)
MRIFTLRLLVALFLGGSYYVSLQSCAQISSPTGGPKDTLSPKLIKATPANASLNVKTGKITLQFNEFIQVQEAQKNLIVSPFQTKQPTVIEGLKTVTIKLKDSLLPNTTYTLNFGDAIKDLNEGNIYKDLTYVFSTGQYLDSLTLEGKVILAETGGVDSTLSVFLYRDAVDTTVQKFKPNYIAKLNSEGKFKFENLPNGKFRVYAIKDGDGSKTYNSNKETFAFLNSEINTANPNDSIELVASVAKATIAAETNKTYLPAKPGALKEKPINLDLKSGGTHNILQPLEISSNNKITKIDATQIKLLDTNYVAQNNVSATLDSTGAFISINTNWKKEFNYVLIFSKTSVTDTLKQQLLKADTIKFKTKAAEDYGKLVLRFPNIDLAKKPILQIYAAEKLITNAILKTKEYTNELYLPGSYSIKIIYDTNADGEYTPGDYKLKRQPERCVFISNAISVRADWENEKDINL